VPLGIARKAGLVSCPWRVGQRAGLAAFFVLFGSQGLQSVIAEGDTRSLSLHHMHTGEDISITFKRNGRYDDEALKKLDWFLRDWRREQSTHMDPQLLDLIWEVSYEVGAKEPIQVVCGYRSPQTNAMLRHRSRGVAQYSQHTVGRAMDFYIPGVSLEQVRIAGLRLQRGGVGFYPTSGSPFVHVDTGSVRHWPRMTHDQLVRVFPDGKTVHVPTDGRPLARYAQALAEVRRHGSTPSATLLAQARDAGAISEGDAQAAGAAKPKRGLLAKLFGFSADEEDADAAERDGSVHAAPAVARQNPVESKPVRLAAVPIPPKAPPRPGQFTLATATANPADAIHARGTWSAAPAAAAVTAVAERADARAATPPGAVNESGQRLVWIAGPEGRPAPRPPQEIVVASADPEPTASTGASSEFAKDRVPAEIALAYAATPAAAPEPPLRAAPMGILGAPVPAAAPAAAGPAPVIVRGEKIHDPWLRGVVMAPSVQYSMHVSVLGPTDYRTLRPLFAKPSFALAMIFSEDPHFGMNAETFGGAAVAFLPTVTFSSRTAGLR
jgi:uncharacterized protein YcbK (DUF882 family)